MSVEAPSEGSTKRPGKRCRGQEQSDTGTGFQSDLRTQVHDAARRARVAARTLGTLATATKNRALHAAADRCSPGCTNPGR